MCHGCGLAAPQLFRFCALPNSENDMFFFLKIKTSKVLKISKVPKCTEISMICYFLCKELRGIGIRTEISLKRKTVQLQKDSSRASPVGDTSGRLLDMCH